MDVDQGWCIGWREVRVMLGSWISLLSVSVSVSFALSSVPSFAFPVGIEGEENIPFKIEVAP